jgi:hypothetical protein
LLYTKPGITNYINYSHSLSTHISSQASTINLTKKQHQKLYLHELCAHEGFRNLNRWIRQGKFPGVEPKLADEPDPMCSICNFGKARRKCHKMHTGKIAEHHTKPGQGVSFDGLESSTPGRPFTTKGSPPKLRYNYVSFWVDHMSAFVYVTFHSSKSATELVRSKPNLSNTRRASTSESLTLEQTEYIQHNFFVMPA